MHAIRNNVSSHVNFCGWTGLHLEWNGMGLRLCVHICNRAGRAGRAGRALCLSNARHSFFSVFVCLSYWRGRQDDDITMQLNAVNPPPPPTSLSSFSLTWMGFVFCRRSLLSALPLYSILDVLQRTAVMRTTTITQTNREKKKRRKKGNERKRIIFFLLIFALWVFKCVVTFAHHLS